MSNKHRSPQTRQTAASGSIDKLWVTSGGPGSLNGKRSQFALVAEYIEQTGPGTKNPDMRAGDRSNSNDLEEVCDGVMLNTGNTGVGQDTFKNIKGLDKIFLGPGLTTNFDDSELQSMGVTVEHVDSGSAHQMSNQYASSKCSDPDPDEGGFPIWLLPVGAGAGLLAFGVVGDDENKKRSRR